jgi:enoyl-CoA hydratase
MAMARNAGSVSGGRGALLLCVIASFSLTIAGCLQSLGIHAQYGGTSEIPGESAMANEILTERKGPILEITLNRPEIGNAASDTMAVELTKLLLGAAESSEIVVLSGAGNDFCVGRETMGKRPPGAPPEAIALRRRNDVVFNCYGAFRRCEIPVIGVVKGRAFGFGCAVAAVCDITLAADTATFQVPEMAHNIMPTMVMSALVDRVPRKAATYLVWSTAVISPARAREAGIVSEVYPAAELDGAVEALCKRIMRAPRPARVGCKDYARTAFDMDVAGAVEYARSIHAVINSSSEMIPQATG